MTKLENTVKVENYQFEPIKGYPMLNWKGKRVFNSTSYFPAQLKEIHGKPDENGWFNKIFWGDNIQAMSHLLKEFRGKVDLIYIDPPFDSKADYKKSIKIHNKNASNDHSMFEEKQYTDLWNNDDYLQYMYERIILLKELLSDKGSFFIHCDYNKSHYLRIICEEIFGANSLVNEIIWRRKQATSFARKQFGITTDTIFWFSKTADFTFNATYSKDDEHTQQYLKERFVYDDGDGRKYMKSPLVNSLYRPNLKYEFYGIIPPENGWLYSRERMEQFKANNELVFPENKTGRIYRKIYADTYKGQLLQNIWLDIPIVNPMAKERVNYPTQKPEALLERIIYTASSEGDIVLDAFLGSGTTASAAIKLKRKFIGIDINSGAIAESVKRLAKSSGFELYNVNNYEIFRNPVEAKELLIETLEITKLNGSIFDGEKNGRMVKIMPINRIATRADLNELISGFDYKTFAKRKENSPNKPVEKLLLVCMGHEPDLRASLELALKETGFEIDVEVVDILRDRTELQFKRDSEIKVSIKKNKLVIEKFYPMNLLQKLSLQKSKVEDWRELVESIMIDWNFDGAVLTPSIVDIAGEDKLVIGEYDIPSSSGKIKLKITDLLSESLEIEVSNG